MITLLRLEPWTDQKRERENRDVYCSQQADFCTPPRPRTFDDKLGGAANPPHHHHTTLYGHRPHQESPE